MEPIFYNEEAEKAILGTIILNNAYLDRVSDLLEPSHFYFTHNQAVYQRFVDVAKDGVANQITLKNFFENDDHIKNVGGALYLSNLLGCASSIIDIRDYARIVLELSRKRLAIGLIWNYEGQLKDSKFNEVTANLINELTGLLINDSTKKTLDSNQLVDELEKDEKEGKGDKFVPTGFSKLDEMLDGGIYSKTMMIIGARPSVGKSSIAQQVIVNTAKKGFRCFFLSLEVDRKHGLLKFLSNIASVPFWKYRKNAMNEIEDSRWTNAKRIYRDLKISINDSSNQNITQLEKIVKNQVERHPFDLLIVDYAQIIKGVDIRNKNEAQIIKENTTALKAMARTYDISVLVLAQINRKGVEGQDQEPTVNDFKGSGGFEEDADYLLILHRNRMQDKKDGYFSNSGKLIVGKNRHGRTGEIAINFEGEFSRFTESNNF